MKAFPVFVLCVITTPCLMQKIYIPHLSEVDAEKYLMRLGASMWGKLKKYGLSNLPDVDAALTFNQTLMGGYRIVGTLYLEDGFVLDVTDIDGLSRARTVGTSETRAIIQSQFTLMNLTLLRTFRYEPDVPDSVPDQTTGTVLIVPAVYQLDFLVAQNLTDKKLKADIQSVSIDQTGEFFYFEPDNGLTNRLRRLYFGFATKTRPLEGLFELWQPIFQSFLEASVEEITFPGVRYLSSRDRTNG